MLMPSIFGENLFDDFFDEFARPARNVVRYNTPATNIMKTDIREHDTGFELDIDLPGYRKEDVKAELKDGYLTISAQTRSDNDEKEENGKYIRRERYYGTCSRSFYVGKELTQDDIKAAFSDGILRLSIPKEVPKAIEEQPRYIAIE